MKPDVILIFKDGEDYLWGLANECGLDYTGPRYEQVTEAIAAARLAFPGLPFMSTVINRATVRKCKIHLLELAHL